MVGAPLKFVKNRDGQFNLGSFLSSHLQGQAQIVFYFIARVERGESSTARSASTRDGWACPVPFS